MSYDYITFGFDWHKVLLKKSDVCDVSVSYLKEINFPILPVYFDIRRGVWVKEDNNIDNPRHTSVPNYWATENEDGEIIGLAEIKPPYIRAGSSPLTLALTILATLVADEAITNRGFNSVDKILKAIGWNFLFHHPSEFLNKLRLIGIEPFSEEING